MDSGRFLVGAVFVAVGLTVAALNWRRLARAGYSRRERTWDRSVGFAVVFIGLGVFRWVGFLH